ncbi:hypothetical protein BBP40_002787 [Aspergillus hancockii]|nr:hypothetical protein BBP40_002787 [Aspergillus hancockii]
MQSYGASKAGTWILSREFARRHRKDGIVSVCLNPAYLKTASFNGTPALVMFIINRVMLHNAIFGAYTELYAGLSPDITLENSGSTAGSDRDWGPEEEGGLEYGSMGVDGYL